MASFPQIYAQVWGKSRGNLIRLWKEKCVGAGARGSWWRKQTAGSSTSRHDSLREIVMLRSEW